MESNPNRRAWGLLRQRQCLVPTGRGWALLAGLVLGLGLLLVRGIHPFLAVTEPMPRGLLVIEGWARDEALAAAAAEFRTGRYERLYVTGGPLELGAPLSEYKTYAELAAATLVRLGLDPQQVQAVPAPRVHQDRTYNAARSLGHWLRQHQVATTQVHLLTEGLHARRSRLLFEKALGTSYQVGITAVRTSDYDPHRWWRSSAGVRGVIGETVAYGYARFLFRPQTS